MNAWNPKNLFNGIGRMFGTDPEGTGDDAPNVRGEEWWLAAAFYVLGNSLGTANTMAGRTRVHLGPVYAW